MAARRLETLAVHAGQESTGCGDGGASGTHIPDNFLRVQGYGARRQPFRPGRAWQHLHQDHEPHDGRLRAAHSRHRGRHGGAGRFIGPGGGNLALLTITQVGDEIVSANNLYGGTYELFHYTFPKLGRRVLFVDSAKPEEFRKAITGRTRALYAETIGNPKLDVPDFEALARHRPRRGHPSRGRQYRGRRPRQAHRLWGGHPDNERHEVHRRPRHVNRRRDRRRRPFQLGQREVPGIHGARPQLPRPQILGYLRQLRGDGERRLYLQGAGAAPARHGRRLKSVQCVALPPGAGDALSCGRKNIPRTPLQSHSSCKGILSSPGSPIPAFRATRITQSRANT